MLGKMSSQEGQRVQVGFMTLMPVARGLCNMTPARPGTLDPRSQVGPVPTLWPVAERTGQHLLLPPWDQQQPSTIGPRYAQCPQVEHSIPIW